MRAGLELIATELERHAAEEGWTPEHDDKHIGEELASAATCYVTPLKWRPFPVRQSGQAPLIWPWSPRWWKPTPNDRIRELVKAGSLIVAEIERLQRLGSNA